MVGLFIGFLFIFLLIDSFLTTNSSDNSIEVKDNIHKIVGTWKYKNTDTDCEDYFLFLNFYLIYKKDGTFIIHKPDSTRIYGNWTYSNDLLQHNINGNSDVNIFQIIGNELYLSSDLESDFTCNYEVYERFSF